MLAVADNCDSGGAWSGKQLAMQLHSGADGGQETAEPGGCQGLGYSVNKDQDCNGNTYHRTRQGHTALFGPRPAYSTASWTVPSEYFKVNISRSWIHIWLPSIPFTAISLISQPLRLDLVSIQASKSEAWVLSWDSLFLVLATYKYQSVLPLVNPRVTCTKSWISVSTADPTV